MAPNPKYEGLMPSNHAVYLKLETSVLEELNDQGTNKPQEAVSNTKCEGPVQLVVPDNQPNYIKGSLLEENSVTNDHGTRTPQEAVSNTKCEGPVQLVVPDNQPNYIRGSFLEENCVTNDQGTSSEQEVSELSEEEEEEPISDVTTRARHTYQLDRFNKNVLLIVTCLDGKPITNVKETFERLKFEVTVVETKDAEVTKEEWQKIRQFFEQDLSTVGAVAVVMATCAKKYSWPKRTPDVLEELDLIQFFFYDNSQLEGKPKIFISEALDPAFHDVILLPDEANPGTSIYLGPYFGPSCYTRGFLADVLYIQSKIIETKTSSLPLENICYAFNSLEEGSAAQHALPTLWEKGVDPRYSLQRSDIKFHSTLTKELVLDRLQDE